MVTKRSRACPLVFAHLERVPVPHSRRGRWYPLVSVLMICSCAVVSGARTIEKIAEWGQRAAVGDGRAVRLPGRPPRALPRCVSRSGAAGQAGRRRAGACGRATRCGRDAGAGPAAVARPARRRQDRVRAGS
ncbi:transposase family protein [Streptomyces sp. NPDC057238]|uniref:transposase family protein n=1 Tax=unclassified Streptomyces TaxID=2593676 RepID=UPI00363DE887